MNTRTPATPPPAPGIVRHHLLCLELAELYAHPLDAALLCASPQRMRVAAAIPRDIIRLSPDGPLYTVAAVASLVADATLRQLWLAELRAPLTLPLDMRVCAVRALRITQAPCVVCRRQYWQIFDAALALGIRGVVCGPCDDAVSRSVGVPSPRP